MEAVWEWLRAVLGIGADDLGPAQAAARALVMYAAALLMIRLGEKRFLGKNTAFDVLLGVILGSVISRAINGSAGLAPTLAAGTLLVGLHWALSALAWRSDWFGNFIKGRVRVLMRDGRVDWDAMRASHISRRDLEGAARHSAGAEDLEQVKAAYLERSGNISVIQARGQPRVVEVQVADGVQTVRIELA